jgi:hypothetical protein
MSYPPNVPGKGSRLLMSRTSPLVSQALKSRHWPLFCLLPLALAVAGCQGSAASSSTYEVKGRILLANGKPLTAGRVTFVAADGLHPEASGDLGPNGEFALSTRGSGDGARPGPYKVRIEPASSNARRPARPVYPLKYIDEDSSGLSVTVRAETNNLDPITLK